MPVVLMLADGLLTPVSSTSASCCCFRLCICACAEHTHTVLLSQHLVTQIQSGLEALRTLQHKHHADKASMAQHPHCAHHAHGAHHCTSLDLGTTETHIICLFTNNHIRHWPGVASKTWVNVALGSALPMSTNPESNLCQTNPQSDLEQPTTGTGQRLAEVAASTLCRQHNGQLLQRPQLALQNAWNLAERIHSAETFEAQARAMPNTAQHRATTDQCH